MANVKFTELPITNSLAATDLLAIVDQTTTASGSITGRVLSNFIYSTEEVTANASTVITGLNGYLPVSGNGLSATKVFADGQYRTGDYLLNYTNATFKPTIPTDIKDLDNADDYVSVSSTTNDLIVQGNLSSPANLTTNSLPEGSNNKYYDDSLVDLRLNARFGELFNLYSNAFDGGTVTDSLVDVPGIFQNIGAGNSSKEILVSNAVASSASFKAAQKLRLYGASGDNATLIGSPPTTSLERSTSFKATAGAGEYLGTWEYRVAHFNLITGEIGPSSAALSINFANDGSGTQEQLYSSFNNDHFIRLTIDGNNTPAGTGALVYRKTNSDTNHKLIAVLGSKELGSAWIDYHTFDATAWSGKNSSDNSYSSISHFPLIAPTLSTGLTGWTDVEIESVTTGQTHFTITLVGAGVTCNSGGAVQICHNDTILIQNAITSKNAVGIKSVNLNAKTYNVSSLSIPDNFGVVGVPNITKIKNLPFSGYIGTDPNNSVIVSSSTTNATAISFSGIDIDGNQLNQYLVSDVTDKTLNYLLDFGINPISTLIDKCRFKDMIGGGISAESPSEFKMNVSEVVNSGLSDRYEEQYSPLIVDAGSSTLVTGNRFENFPHHIDASVTQEGVFTNNVIKACGSGLFLYGATFVVSSPNILIGAANEFLSSPDVLNSEYDSINIPLARFAGAGDYLSDPFTYQEDGAAFNLTTTFEASSNASIVYRANLVSILSSTGAGQIYGHRIGPAQYGIAGRTDLPLIEGKRYRIQEVGNTDWRKVGAVANKVGIEFIAELGTGTARLNSSPTLEQVGSTSASTTGYVESEEFVGYMADATTQRIPIEITNVTGGVTPANGEFKFSIPVAVKNEIEAGFYSQATLRGYYATELAASRRLAGSSHDGIAWSASLRRQVVSGNITTQGSWAADGSDAFGSYRDFAVSVSDPQYIIVGSHVIINNKSGFSTGLTNVVVGDVCDPVHGIVQTIGALVDGNRLITVRYYKGLAAHTADGGASGATAGAGTDGTLNIIDDFVMAQGLIK